MGFEIGGLGVAPGKYNINHDFMSMYKNSMKEVLGEDAQSEGSGILNGHVQVQVPKNLDSLQDKELAQDLKQLMVDPSSSGSNSSVNAALESGSPAKVLNTFQRALSDGINNVNKTQVNAEKTMEAFASGANIDVHTVMISSQKAQLSMQMAMQLRNKLVQAYQEVSRIQV